MPGVSVLTPARGMKGGGGLGEPSVRRDGGGGAPAPQSNNLWDSDSEGEEGAAAGMSPPKTMQFHIPQSRLMRTPGTGTPALFC